MSKAKSWMPVYIGDYLADTGHLTCEQHGAYLQLLMHQWRTGSVPDDAEQICLICSLSPGRYGRVARPVLERYFRLDADMRWRNPRCTAEHDAAESRYAKAVAKASRAAVLRWRKPAE